MVVSGGEVVDDSISSTESTSSISDDRNQLNDPLGKINQFIDDEDGRIREHIQMSEDPSDFIVQPGNTLCEWTLKLLRA